MLIIVLGACPRVNRNSRLFFVICVPLYSLIYLYPVFFSAFAFPFDQRDRLRGEEYTWANSLRDEPLYDLSNYGMVVCLADRVHFQFMRRFNMHPCVLQNAQF